MKSGYGIYANVTAKLTVTTKTNAATTTATLNIGQSTSSVIAPQYVQVIFPEFCYSTYNRLLRKAGSTTTYEFKANEYSSFGDNTHYTPIWFADDSKYIVFASCLYAYTPVGVITVGGESNPIYIEGNIYDDWHIAPVQ